MDLLKQLHYYAIEPFDYAIKAEMFKYIKQYSLFPYLDVCCMSGAFCDFLGKTSGVSMGIDFSFAALKFGRLKKPSLNLVCADGSKIPFGNNSFAGIGFRMSLHDKSETLQKEFLLEAHRLLRPNGKIIISEFDVPWSTHFPLRLLSTFFIELASGHFSFGMRFLRNKGLHGLMVNAGLREIARTNIQFPPCCVVVAEFLQQ